MANKKKPTAKSNAAKAGGSATSNGPAQPANATGSSAGRANGSDSVGMSNDLQWNRRKAWPLVLGSAAVLGGATVANYHFSNPDGKLTAKAEDALAAVYPGAKVRVHGRDAIITDLPPGADRKVAHDLIRRIEGVRNVKQESGGLVPVDTSASSSESESTVVAPASAADPIVGDSLAPSDTTAPDTTAPDTTPADTAVADTTPADTAVADTTPTDTTVAADTAPAVSAPAESAAPTSETPTTAAPATAGSEAADGPVEPLRFASGSATLDADGTAAVAALVETLTQNPDARLDVVGHADSRGTRLSNLAISRARADAVVEALVAAGIDRSRITSVGKGDRLPIESNDTEDGRAANRRVEVLVAGVAGASGEVSYTG